MRTAETTVKRSELVVAGTCEWKVNILRGSVLVPEIRLGKRWGNHGIRGSRNGTTSMTRKEKNWFRGTAQKTAVQ
jgi:hypothetical protein